MLEKTISALFFVEMPTNKKIKPNAEINIKNNLIIVLCFIIYYFLC